MSRARPVRQDPPAQSCSSLSRVFCVVVRVSQLNVGHDLHWTFSDSACEALVRSARSGKLEDAFRSLSLV